MGNNRSVTELESGITAAVARECARIHTRLRGRGPWKTRVFYRPELLVVLMEDTLTIADKTLLADGKQELVEQIQSAFESAMEPDLVSAVERLTGAEVVAFMSGHHMSPDMAVEVYVLTPPDAVH
jgi:uncharacterized protein YbcI